MSFGETNQMTAKEIRFFILFRNINLTYWTTEDTQEQLVLRNRQVTPQKYLLPCNPFCRGMFQRELSIATIVWWLWAFLSNHCVMTMNTHAIIREPQSTITKFNVNKADWRLFSSNEVWKQATVKKGINTRSNSSRGRFIKWLLYIARI